MKKEMKRLLSLACAMVLSFPAIGYAADAEVTQDMPVSVKADCAFAYHNEDEIKIKEITITENTADAFSESQQMYFSVKNKPAIVDVTRICYSFADQTTRKVADETLEVEYKVENGDLIVMVEESDPDKVESFTIKNLTVKKNTETVVLRTYSLFMSTEPDAEKVPVVMDFMEVDMYTPPVEKKKLDISIGMNEKTLQVNGEEKALRVPAYISDRGYTMLPIREVTEVFPGVKVLWNNEKKEAIILYGYDYVSIIAGANVMHINGKENILKNVAEVKDGRMFISLRDVCRICNVPTEDVHWDTKTKTASINTYVY
ncbi:stalk domain-containing protein [Anaerotignum sp.]